MDATTRTSQNGWSGLFSLRHLPHSTIFAGGVVLHAMNVFISATILPSVVAEIGGMAYYAWATTLFTATSIISAALSAKLVSRVGARTAYIIALAIFASGTIICATAPSIGVLNLGRAVQGFGGGALYSLAYIVIRMVFSRDLRAIAVGLISVMWGVATLTGPALGGIFADIGQWRMAFWALLPAVGAIAVLCLLVLPGEKGASDRTGSLPVRQMAVMAAMVTALSLAGSCGELVSTVFWSALFLVLGFAFVLFERRAQSRVLPTGTFSRNSRIGLLYGFVALMLLGMQPEVFVPYFAQALYGISPLVAGYVGAVMALGWTFGSVISAGYGRRAALRTLHHGSVFSFSGLAMVALVTGSDTAGLTPLLLLCTGLLAIGFGIGFCWPHVTTQVYDNAPQGEEETAASGMTTVQLSATAIGAAFAGLVVNNSLDDHGDAAAASFLFAIFALAPAGAFLVNRLMTRP